MVEQGYYSKRIDELEMRKAELQGQLVSAKLSLKAINNEIESCREAMNSQTMALRTDIDRKDETIKSLKKKIKEAKDIISNLKLENTQLKHDLQNSKKKVDDLKKDSAILKQKLEIIKDEGAQYPQRNTIDNIFEQYMEDY